MPAMQRARGGACGDVAAVEVNGAGIGPDEPGDEVEQRRFAGAVRSDDAERLAARDLEVDAVDGFERAERSRQIVELEDHEIVQSSVRSKCAQTIFAMSAHAYDWLDPGLQAPINVRIGDARFRAHRVRERQLQNADLQAIGSILPPVGISGAVLLSVMTMSYLLPFATAATDRRPAASWRCSLRRTAADSCRPRRSARPRCRAWSLRST